MNGEHAAIECLEFSRPILGDLVLVSSQIKMLFSVVQTLALSSQTSKGGSADFTDIRFLLAPQPSTRAPRRNHHTSYQRLLIVVHWWRAASGLDVPEHRRTSYLGCCQVRWGQNHHSHQDLLHQEPGQRYYIGSVGQHRRIGFRRNHRRIHIDQHRIRSGVEGCGLLGQEREREHCKTGRQDLRALQERC
ncbi:hypothetical protein HG530_012905 [Fusarium avenaceum]|nr:hypothetical protein HG530_012905 [Fusarium avenaceum]